MKSSTPRDAVQLSPNAVTVLEKRYLVKDDTGRPAETPSDLFWRVARTVAEADRKYGATETQSEQAAQEFYDIMAGRLFMPNSPTLMNAGRPLGQLSACFVLPVDDALSNGKSGIYDTLRAMALVHQSGGGHRVQLLPAPAQERHRALHHGRGLGPGLLHEPVRRLHRRGEAGRHPPGRQHGHPAGGPSRHHGVHHLQGRHDQDHQLQHLGRGHRQVHGGGGEGRRLRPDPPQDRPGHRPAQGARRLGPDHPRRLEDGRAGRVLRRQGQLLQSGPAPRQLRGDQPLRRAAPPSVRRLQPRLHQPRRVRHSCVTPSGARGRLGCPPPRDPASRPTSSRTSSTPTSTRWTRSTTWPSTSAASGSASWAWPISSCGSASPTTPTRASRWAGRSRQFVDEEAKKESERLAEIRGVFPEWDQSIWGPDDDRGARARRRAGPADAPAPELQRHHRGADGDDLHHRQLQLGHRAAVRGGVHAEPGRRADAGRQ